jgi:hypothetical protein
MTADPSWVNRGCMILARVPSYRSPAKAGT